MFKDYDIHRVQSLGKLGGHGQSLPKLLAHKICPIGCQQDGGLLSLSYVVCNCLWIKPAVTRGIFSEIVLYLRVLQVIIINVCQCSKH